MTGSIIDQLVYWLATRRANLVQAGIEITDRLPQPSSNVPWKGSIGLVKDDILVSYTVWERTVFQTSLILWMVNREKLYDPTMQPQSILRKSRRFWMLS
jgi:hypothetical protein